MGKAGPLDIYVIGDTQVRPGVKNPLKPVAHDIVKEKPDYVIHLGDHFDFPSLSSYDKGKKSFIKRRYIDDVDAGNESFYEFWSIIDKAKLKTKFIFLLGNHENRLSRAIEYEPSEFEGLLDLCAPDFSGWKVIPFLKPYKLNGICFAHYIQNEFTGKPLASAKITLARRSCSFVQGHKQCLDQAEQNTLDGKRIMGLVMGACYFHDEEYKGEQGNNHWRGIAVLRNAYKGCWEVQIKNLKTLDKLYGKI